MPDIDEGNGAAPLRDPQSKTHHIDVCLTDAVEFKKSAGFERWDFINQPLPEQSLDDIDLSTQLCGKDLGAPLMIAPMTGGVARALELNKRLARALIDAGISGIDCAGAGGTSWAKVEGICAKTERRKKMGMRFGEWGTPTSDAILAVRAASKRIPLIATGGLRSGIDVAKAIALGADLGAMARPMLVAAHAGEDVLDAFIDDVLTELRISMFGIGAGDLEALKGTAYLREMDHKVPPRV